MSDEFMLSTVDNPYNPFIQFDEWLDFDTYKGYNTCGVLARITLSSDELSEVDQSLAIQAAIDELVLNDPLGIFMKVKKED